MSLIEVASLTVLYGGRTALDGVAFSVPEGAVQAMRSCAISMLS